MRNDATVQGKHRPGRTANPDATVICALPRRPARPRLLAAALAGSLLMLPVAVLAQPRVERVSVNDRGRDAEGLSNSPAVSEDARFVAFFSDAPNLVSGDRNGVRDVFVRDRERRRTERVSVSVDGRDANGRSQPGGFAPAISADGRFVAFSSLASNLVADDTNRLEDLFVRDRSSGTTERVSLGIDGEANGASNYPDLSADGRYVVFQSRASNLVPDDRNGVSDIFLFDRETRTTRRVSVATDGSEANGFSITPSISGDGRVVAFASAATNLVAGDTNDVTDIFVHDWQAGVTRRVSVSSSGAQANRVSFIPELDFAATVVAFKSEAFNLVPADTNGVPDVFVHDLETGDTERVSVDSFGNQSNDLSGPPSIDADGRFVAFPSFASNFVPGDGNGLSDIFVFDRRDRTIERVTIGLGGAEPDGGVPDFPPSMSPNGQWVGFASAAANLVPNDVNNEIDVFVRGNPLNPPPTEPTPTPTTPGPDTPTPTPTPTGGPAPCVGDCDNDGRVTIDEIIRMINIALGANICGEPGAVECLAGDADCDCEITVDEIIRAVNNGLGGCTDFAACSPEDHAAACCGPPGTPGVTPPTRTPTPTQPPSPLSPCVGDCNGDGAVTIDEVIRMINIALGRSACGDGEVGACLAGDADCNCEITVDEIIRAVNNGLLPACDLRTACSAEEHDALCCGP